ncbi:MAG: 50S ribosomal protein L18e [Candidatus Aenigmarchaeota archaeon]|nr:50S ribosomal protein L18e [Candidatus Aenigmarchaeota archaeon]
MTKRTGPTNPRTKETVISLYAASQENKAKIWKDIAERIQKPKRIIPCVNVGKIEKCTKANESVVVPGKILGEGAITKKITVCALSASESAVEKIKKAGGSYMTIEDFVKSNPKGKKTRILA